MPKSDYDISKPADRFALQAKDKENNVRGVTWELLMQALTFIEEIEAHRDHLKIETLALSDRVLSYGDAPVNKSLRDAARAATASITDNLADIMATLPISPNDFVASCPTCGSEQRCMPCDEENVVGSTT